MSVNDPLGDMLTRIRNAQMRRRPKVATPASSLRARVLDVLRPVSTSARASLASDPKRARGPPQAV